LITFASLIDDNFDCIYEILIIRLPIAIDCYFAINTSRASAPKPFCHFAMRHIKKCHSIPRVNARPNLLRRYHTTRIYRLHATAIERKDEYSNTIEFI